MLSPSALLFNRYRSFEKDETLPLRPLTLLYGRNNAGKSALARALALIGASISESAPSELVIPPELLRDGSLTDLAWRGDAGDYSFSLGLQWQDGELREVRYTIDSAPDQRPYVKELVLRGDGGKLIWEGRAAPGRPMRPQAEPRGKELRFVGMVPQESAVPSIRLLAERLKDLRGRMRWLDGVRARPARITKRTGVAPAQMAPNGSNAAEFLVEQPDLIEFTRRFYADLRPARDLEVKEELELGNRIRLNPTNRASFRLDLTDTGEGMAQVLPVLVAAALAAREGSGSVVGIEEPESHLHPDAQAVLARHLCSIAAAADPPTLVLETHSRVFLLGVQLAVAEGRLPCDRVGLVWVDQDEDGRSSITPVELASSGHPLAGWPVTALAADLLLARALAKLDLLRGS